VASPVDAGRTTSGQPGSTAAQNKVCPLPATIGAGDLLIMTLRSAGADTHTTPAGWTALVLNNQADASTANQTTSIFYKLATGAEGANVTVTCTTNLKFATIARRITGAADPTTQPPQLSTIAVATTATSINPTVVTPTGGSKDYLFLWIGCWDGEQSNPPAAAPTGYTNVVWANTGTGGATTTNCQVVGYSRQATVALEDAPALTISAAPSGSSAWTMAIHPAVPQALFEGIVLGVPVAVGALTTEIRVTGSVLATGLIIGELIVPAAPALFDAAASATATLDAGLTTLGPSALFTGALGGTATPAGALTTLVRFVGALSNAATLAGGLTTGTQFAAVPTGTAFIVGSLTGTGAAFIGSAMGMASLIATLQTGARFEAAVGATAALAGNLSGMAADLGARLPTHTARDAAVRLAAPVAYPLYTERQVVPRQAAPRGRRTSVRIGATRTTELTRV
jgi:hypothetical protein